MAVGYVVCTVFAALFPTLAMQLLGWVAHLVNIDAQVRVTFGGFVGGLPPLVFYSFGGAWSFAKIYNLAARPRSA